ncbi:hypothetical protein [Rhizorhabdus sp.]|uniref:hypothetical protein n=1 Tax=Rhizorhabdus sp. TaxID=1968843 RepID=UPI00199F128B|nr:hypothetical protein [Rhizorhabdus sp.]MBD3762500.1 hypothetical protein [Rhizorhabdus sp.]
MADFWISFRVHKDTQYDNRYNALDKAIGECATGGSWRTDTSFVCIRSKYSIDACGAHLKKALNTSSDHLVMREIGKNDTRYINNPGAEFSAFFPAAKKL